MDAQHEAHLGRIIKQFSDEVSAKYRKGQAEHGGNLWQKPGMLDYAIEEALDQVVYLFTMREQRQLAEAPIRPVVYVAGPYRGRDNWAIENNIRRAEELALEVWRLGAAAVCPHTNTRFYQGAAPDELWLQGDLAILAKCDAVIVTPDWQRSSGARAEVLFAEQRHIPVFLTLEDLAFWMNAKEREAVPV